MVIVLMIVAFLVHEGLAFWNVAYAVGRREALLNEQHVHGFLEVLPFMAVSFVICLHWNQFLALFGAGPESARWTLGLKRPMLPAGYLIAILAAVLLFLAVPYAEELWRCLRAKPAT